MTSVLLASLLSGTGLGASLLASWSQPERIEALARGFEADVGPLRAGLSARMGQLHSEPGLADETFGLLAPLAERVGLSEQRAALEDASFRVVDPDAHAALAISRPDPAVLDGLVADARDLLATLGVHGTVEGRSKSLYSTWSKMQRKGLAASEIHDRVAVRVVVDTEEACREIVAGLHERFVAVPGEFDDYIAQPKASGYRSLHTALHVYGATAEVQVRTFEMHAEAESGDAAHWKYKLG